MNENTLRLVEKKLNSKCYATNNAWLRDCVEYYLGENNNPQEAEVLEFVVSQWQLSDLREISNEKPCLPRNLANEKCKTLQGRFILQMEKVYDISESKYKQLGKIRDESTENVEITEAERTQATAEPKKKRMLYLELTDGIQDVIGIEYKPIRFLSDSLLPGYKVLIKGPVVCRRGVLLLDEKTIEGIGGEVASLLVPNALENVLARALNLPENPDPYKDSEDAKADEDELFNDDFDIDIDDVAVIESEELGTAISATRGTEQSIRSDWNIVESRNEAASNSRAARTESDILLEDIDDVMFDDDSVVEASSLGSGSDRNSANVGKTATATKVEQHIEPSSRLNVDAKSNDCPTSVLSRLRLENEHRASTSIARSKNSPRDSPQRSAVKRRASVLSPPASRSPAEKMHCSKVLQKSVTTNHRKITDFMRKAPVSSSTEGTSKIHDSVRDALNAKCDSETIYKTIRGKVTKFDKLSKEGQRWQLNATIIDSTGSIDVTFASKVLESMLGFSVAEFSVKKKLKKTDPNMEAYLRQGFRNAEERLSQLDDVMELELAPNQKPQVVKIGSKNDR